MRPRLLLLTGPAAQDVAGVFSWGCKPREVFQLGDNIQQAQWWDEVRDYWEAPRKTCVLTTNSAIRGTEYRIRSLPGGEAWLVGLVLLAAHMTEPLHLTCGHSNVGNAFALDCETCRLYRQLPRRLAILAPDPPALLVERVRAWGGEVWDCFSPSMGPEAGWAVIRQDKPGAVPGFPTWPAAVRAALGDPS